MPSPRYKEPTHIIRDIMDHMDREYQILCQQKVENERKHLEMVAERDELQRQVKKVKDD